MAYQSRIEFLGGEASPLCLVTSKPREDLSDLAAYKRMVFYGVRSPGPGSDIGDERESACRLLGVVSSETESVVEFFPTRAQAEAMIADVRADESELAELL